jgi:carboxylesterase type B
LTSTELREAGYGTNNVLRDQLTALKWIQKHITGFSGDPQNVTLAGEKIGAACIAYQMHNPEPLFSRIMLISGSHFLQPPISFETAEENYQKIIDVLGLKSCSPEERIRALLSADGQTLNKELARAGITMLPVLDYDLIEHMPTFESTTTGSWQCPGRGHFKGAIM